MDLKLMYNIDKKSLIKSSQQIRLRKNSLRHNEYYDMQPIFDNLYKQSQSNSKFTHLYDTIIRDENILLAFRNIKRNNGSMTAGIE